MRYRIEHDLPGRVRVRLAGSIPAADALAMREYLQNQPSVGQVIVYPRIGSIALRLNEAYGSRDARRAALAALDDLDERTIASLRPAHLGHDALRSNSLGIVSGALSLTVAHFARRLLLPAPIRAIYVCWKALAYFKEAFKALAGGSLNVTVLDAAAIGVSLLRRDFSTASSTVFLLRLSSYLEDATRRHAASELVYSLLDVPDRVWLVDGDTLANGGLMAGEGPRLAAGTGAVAGATAPQASPRAEILTDRDQLAPGDVVHVYRGSQIPVDGVVVAGEAHVNQATLTGESLPVLRQRDDSVYAGTTIEDGELFIRVTALAKDTKLRSIVAMVEQSESYKSNAQQRAEKLADAIVPWNFALFGLLLLATRSLAKASAALLVDYSCTLRLTGSIAGLSAMREAANKGFTVKGSRFLEEMAKATTIVFDKTGTLTEAHPSLAYVDSFGDWAADEVLRLAACLEEHFPHPVARAVVNAAFSRKLDHRERHAAVEYVVAHGIASGLDGRRVIIGSAHFIFEDEGVAIDAQRRAALENAHPGSSGLYLAVDGELVGALYLSDPLKSGLAQTMGELRSLGFKRLVMLTGDNLQTARRIADAAGLDECHADLLPQDKHRIIERLKQEGEAVVMVGDGINDAPALSAADIGIAMGDGAAIAREIADVTLGSSDLGVLVDLRRLSMRYCNRVDRSYFAALGINTGLLALATGGVLTASASSVIHNATTVSLSLNNMRKYLPQ
jgi:heavy metal translocating P-type ATPase